MPTNFALRALLGLTASGLTDGDVNPQRDPRLRGYDAMYKATNARSPTRGIHIRQEEG